MTIFPGFPNSPGKHGDSFPRTKNTKGRPSSYLTALRHLPSSLTRNRAGQFSGPGPVRLRLARAGRGTGAPGESGSAKGVGETGAKAGRAGSSSRQSVQSSLVALGKCLPQNPQTTRERVGNSPHDVGALTHFEGHFEVQRVFFGVTPFFVALKGNYKDNHRFGRSPKKDTAK